VAVGFNECINARDLKGLARLMANNHTFIDTTGTAVVVGKAACIEAWGAFSIPTLNTETSLKPYRPAVTGSLSSATPCVRESPRSKDLRCGQLLPPGRS
jgi:hypothetical protein